MGMNMQSSFPQATEINSSKALKECILFIKNPVRSILLAKVADLSPEEGKDNRDHCSMNACQHRPLC